MADRLDGKTVEIAVTAPACAVKRETADAVIALAARRYGDAARVHFHPQCFMAEGHFAGDDRARSAAFVEFANSPRFDALWFGRGGYGSCRLDEAVFGALGAAARRKTYLGYSDLGTLMARLYKEGVGRITHGPMPSDIARADGEAAVARALDFLVRKDISSVEAHALKNKCLAFNLTILVHLLDTPHAPDFTGHVLMLEDVGEHHYRIDRAFFAITSSEKIRKCAGIMLGRCSDIPGNDPPFLRTEEEIARYWCARSGIAYLGRCDIGHDAANKIVPFGGALLA